MYKLSIPIVTENTIAKKEESYQKLLEAGANRVFLGIGIVSLDSQKNEKYLATLRDWIPYFKSKGLEVGVWVWTFWRSELDDEYLEDCMQMNSSGKKRLSETDLNTNVKNHSGFCCPASEKFVNDSMSVIKEIAELNPDIIMFDDDYRFGSLGGYSGCYCKHHLKMVSDKLGREITREELFKKVYEGKPNEERKAFFNALGESMENFAVRVRETVDSVNPNIRFALCAVLSLWDNDGTNCIKIAKLLAGKTKPLMRLIGAPYWALDAGWGISLNNIVELERMQMAWVGDEDIEIMPEGDVYPRPRHKVPSAHLECFDSILRASDVGDGILKYMIDYKSTPNYEKGYIKHHLKNKEMYEAIPRVFGGKECVGVRVYESMEKVRNTDFTDTPEADRFTEEMFHSRSARVLSDNSIPTRHIGNNGVGVAFGENARNLPDEALQNGLILDIRAARILMEQGIDVGIEKIGDRVANDLIFYPEFNEVVKSYYGGDSAYNLKLKENARIIAYSKTDNEKTPDTFAYENASGQRFLVFGFDAMYTDMYHYRNYCTRDVLIQEYEWLSKKKIPVKVTDNPYTYVLCKKDDKGNMAVGLWNIFADEMIDSVIELDGEYSSAEIIGAKGKLAGDKVKIENLPAFKFCFIDLKK